MEKVGGTNPHAINQDRVTSSDSDALATALQSADVLVTDPNNFSRHEKLMLSAGSKLQWVQSSYAGVEKFMNTLKSLGLVRN